MAKSKVSEAPAAGQPIPLSRIRLTWTPPYSGRKIEPITIDGSRLAWLLRMGGARPPVAHSTPQRDLAMVELQLTGLSHLLGALSDGIPEEYDEAAIFWFLHQATAAMLSDLKHADPLVVESVLESASVTVAEEQNPTAAVA